MHDVLHWLDRLSKPWIMLSYVGLIVLSYLLIDVPLARYVHSLALRDVYPILSIITDLGRSGPYLCLLPLIALFYRYVKRSKQNELRAWFVCLGIWMASAIAFVLKILIGRARPELLFMQHIYGFYGFHLESLYHSCPSGHTTMMTALALSLSVLFPSYRVLFLLFALLVIGTRVLLTYHYFSDVLLSSGLVVLEYRLLFYIITREYPLYWVRLGLK